MQQDSREFILQTAFALFLQKSYKAVTLKELMDKTGFSKGAFYHYFRSKEYVFEAIIDTYFQAATHIDFSQFSHHSLREFLHDYQQHIATVSLNMSRLTASAGEDANPYSLIFEALRILPDFRTRILQQQQQELEAWVGMIEQAKSTGEIRTQLPDTQVATLFIHASDGITIQSILRNNLAAMRDSLAEEWGNLYSLLVP